MWNRKILIIAITTIAAISSVFYSLSLPNIYSSKSVLAPTSQEKSLSSALGAYSSLAGMAGISLGGSGDNMSIEAMARIKSFDFFEKHFLPFIDLENLLAVEKWNMPANKITYNEESFDDQNKKWIRKVKPPKSVIPSNQEAFKEYKKIVSVNEDKKTQYVVLSVSHKSPYIAKKWNDLIINNINESMRDETKKIADESIIFLNKIYGNAKKDAIKTASSELIEAQMQKLMLASVGKDYVYKTIDSPLVAEIKSSPNRALICIVGTFIGGFISLISAILLHFREKF